MKKNMTVSELAKFLRKAKGTIYNNINQGSESLPPYFREGSRILFPREQLDEWIRNRMVNSNDVKVHKLKMRSDQNG